MRSPLRPGVQPLLRRALSNSKILSAERERELLTRYHANQDKAAMDELVHSHMPMIFRIAGGSARNPGVDINDLVQTATEGLLIAINRWSFEKSDASGARYANELAQEAVQQRTAASGHDGGEEAAQAEPAPDVLRSSRLATYAMWWMRILLTDSVIESRGVIVRAKNPKVRKALFSLPLAIKKLDIHLPLTGSDLGRIAAFIGVAEREIEEALIHAAGDVMLDEPIGDGTMLRGEVIPDERAEGEDGILARLAATHRWNAVCEALMELSSRDRLILVTRYLLSPKWKLDRLSEMLKMSRERIRQIGVDGLDQIRRNIEAANPPHDRRRPGRRDMPAALMPLLRGAATVGARGHDRMQSTAEMQVATLVDAIERASAASDPEVMARFLRDQQLAIGPTRITNRRRPEAANLRAALADQDDLVPARRSVSA
jgi:RNA polymerase sigma-32 factor